MCLTYMNCMTFDNKQFTDLKKKLVFVVQKYIKHVVVLHYKSIWLNHCPSGCPSNTTPTSTNIPGSNQEGNIYFQNFNFFIYHSKEWRIFSQMPRYHIRSKNPRYAVSYIACFASLQYLHYRNLHFGPACICDAKHFIKYAIVIGKWGRLFLSLCHTPPSFSPIRNHICTLIKIVLRFQ